MNDSSSPGFHGWLLAAVIALAALAAAQLLVTLTYAPLMAAGLRTAPVTVFRVGAHVILTVLLVTSVCLVFMRFALARQLLVVWATLTLITSAWTSSLDGKLGLAVAWPLIPLFWAIGSKQLKATLDR